MYVCVCSAWQTATAGVTDAGVGLLFPQAHVCEHFPFGRECLRVSQFIALCLQGTIATLLL